MRRKQQVTFAKGLCGIGDHEHDETLLVCIHKGNQRSKWTFIRMCNEHYVKSIANSYPVSPVERYDLSKVPFALDMN